MSKISVIAALTTEFSVFLNAAIDTRINKTKIKDFKDGKEVELSLFEMVNYIII